MLSCTKMYGVGWKCTAPGAADSAEECGNAPAATAVEYDVCTPEWYGEAVAEVVTGHDYYWY